MRDQAAQPSEINPYSGYPGRWICYLKRGTHGNPELIGIIVFCLGIPRLLHTRQNRLLLLAADTTN